MSDLTFNYIFAELTKHIAEDIIHLGIDVPIEVNDEQVVLSQAITTTQLQDGGARLTDASFVDDLTTYAEPKAMTAASIRGTAQKVLDTVVKWTFAHGMRPEHTSNRVALRITCLKSLTCCSVKCETSRS